MTNYFYRIISIASCLSLSSHLAFSDPNILTFDNAVQRAFQQSPQLKISETDVDGWTGEEMQARLFPNPIVGYGLDKVFGARNWRGWKSAESSYVLDQLIELGGKRTHRTSVAENEVYAAQAGFEASKLELLNRLRKAFVGLVAAQEELKIAQDQKNIASEVLNAVLGKVEAGKVSPIQQNKADIALSNAEINLEMAQMDLTSSKEKLALLWGSTCVDFDYAEYPFFEIDKPKDLCEFLADLSNNPELIQSQYEHLAAHQNLKLQKSNAIPDVVVTVGYKTAHNSGNRGMILAASIPLPIFNQNQGNIHKARADIDRAQEQYNAAQLNMENKLSLSYRELLRAYQEVNSIKRRVLNSCDENFELTREGYLQGKFEYLELLDAQRTQFEIKERYIHSLLNYHERRADIEYLTSRVD